MESRWVVESVRLFPCNRRIRQITELFDWVVRHSQFLADLRIDAIGAIVVGACIRRLLRVTSRERIVRQGEPRNIQIGVGILVSRPVIDAEYALVIGESS